MAADNVREGPIVSIVASCSGCIHERSESYAVQGDSGYTVRCNHPGNPGKCVGDTAWKTPDWCPLLPVAIERLVTKISTKKGPDDAG